MNVALILSGGIGSRVGADIPKQYVKVNNRMIVTYSLKTICGHPEIDAVQIVADSVWQESILEELANVSAYAGKVRGFSIPGKNRQLSIYNGLKDIKAYAGADSAVLIHDAARPLLTSEQITSCMNALEGHDGVLPVLPMKDTVYLSNDGQSVSRLLNRSLLYAGQAPEVFLLDRYLEANERLLPDAILSINGSTEPAIMAGMDVAMIAGDENNYKITSRADLDSFIDSLGKGAE